MFNSQHSLFNMFLNNKHRVINLEIFLMEAQEFFDNHSRIVYLKTILCTQLEIIYPKNTYLFVKPICKYVKQIFCTPFHKKFTNGVLSSYKYTFWN